MTTVKVSRSLLRKVIAHFADSIHEFRQNETAPDGSIEIEAQEMVESEELLLAELRQALAEPAEQPSEGDVGRDELKPCPFCGGAPEIVGPLEEHESGYVVQCKQCLASSRLHFPCGDDPKPHVASVWNKRATTPPQEPVAYVMSSEGEPRIAILRASALEPGTKLYLAPPANDEAVRLANLLNANAVLLPESEGTEFVIPRNTVDQLIAFLTHKQEGKDNG